MSELDELRKKKLAEFQNRFEQQEKAETDFEEQRGQLEHFVRQYMSKDAISRYGNIKAAHPEKSVQVLVVLAQLLQQGKLKTVDDQTLKDVLLRLTPPKRDTKITKD
jgi:programmed cell death protein 5